MPESLVVSVTAAQTLSLASKSWVSYKHGCSDSPEPGLCCSWFFSWAHTHSAALHVGLRLERHFVVLVRNALADDVDARSG